MARDRRIDSDVRLVWTANSSAVGGFHPFTPGLATLSIKEVRATILEILALTSDIEVKLAYQLADEDREEEYGLWTDLGSFVDATGKTYDATWTDVTSALTKRFVRFGFVAKNKTGSTVQIAHVAARLDIREI